MSYELIGTLASIIVLISFIARGENKIRIINIIGALIFVIYGLLINAFSVWFLNGMLILIHLYKIKRKW
mgnify:FL=1